MCDKTRFALIAAFLLSGCASMRTGLMPKSSSGQSNQIAGSDLVPSASQEAEGGDDDEGDEEDVADTERREETPEDVEEGPVAEKRSAEEIEADDLARKTFPLVYNELVASWIKYFNSSRGHPVMQKWLGRSTRYIPMMKQVLRDEGLPEDLIYLSMIESGFNPKAASKAKAVGPWQFIKSTGQRYGLTVNYWVDERRDYRKATYAAAQYLKELQQIFGSWYLAAAGYNAGEGKVLAAVRRDRTRNFWELARKKKNFRSETKNYVPKIIAAALVSKNPEKYGFTDVGYENPLSWESVSVPGGVDLRQVAQITSEDDETILLLNPELRRGMTPPNQGPYELRVPPTKKDILAANLDKLETKKVANFVEHTVRRGESLASVARRYGTDVGSLVRLNGLKGKNAKLKPGRELTVPVAQRVVAELPGRDEDEKVSRPTKAEKIAKKKEPASAITAASAPAPVVASTSASGSYMIQSGDSLWSIAKRFGTTVNVLQRLNRFRSPRAIKPGVVINLPNGSPSSPNG